MGSEKLYEKVMKVLNKKKRMLFVEVSNKESKEQHNYNYVEIYQLLVSVQIEQYLKFLF